MIFHRYWFHPLHIQHRTCKEQVKTFESVSRYSQIVLSVTTGATIHCLLLEGFAENLTPLGASFSPQHPQFSGLKRSWCQGAFLGSSETVKAATHLLYEQGKQRVCSLLLSWLLCFSQWETESLRSFSLPCLREHLWNIKATECGRGPAIWMWPFANCLHQRSSPLKFCHEHWIPFSLTWLYLLPPFFSTRPLRVHIRHSVFTEILFILQLLCLLELQIPNCGTSKI